MCQIISLDKYRKKKDSKNGTRTLSDTSEDFVGFVIDDEEFEKLLKEINDDRPLPF